MSIALWRIARETDRYPADDVSGAVVSETESRWASPGASVVYCSTNIALAVLEALCHMRKSTVPYNRFLVRLDIPEAVWDMREMLDAPRWLGRASPWCDEHSNWRRLAQE